MNTNYFHKSTIQRRRRNNITCLKDERGVWIDDMSEITKHVSDFYHSLFSGTREVTDFSFLQDFPAKVTSRMNECLTRPVSDDEIKSVAFQVGPTKSPGPDGFLGRFFQEHWSMLEGELCGEVISFFRDAKVPNRWNDTFITLIPKVSHPETISQLLPISLTNFKMKLISKIMSNRLKPFIPMLVSELQAAFTGNRQIQDNVIVVHEIIHKLKTRKKGKKCDFLLKLDMLKAYDRVSWDFLFVTLRAMGFSEIWISWISALITSV
ncbi:Transposon TX1 uncharacterized 149 kDa protein [Linum perenne]